MAKDQDWGINDKVVPPADWGNDDKPAAARDLPPGMTPSTAGAGRGNVIPGRAGTIQQSAPASQDTPIETGDRWARVRRKLWAKPKPSVMEGVTLPDPQLDPELNRQAMLKSSSPDSVMFSAGRGKQAADQAVTQGKKLQDLAARGGYASVPEMMDAQAESERRKRFAQENPRMASAASGAASMLKGSINAPGAAAGFVNKSFVDPVLNAVGAKPMPATPVAPGTDSLNQIAGDFTPEVAKLPPEEAWDKGVFGNWLAAKVSAQVPQVGGLIAGVMSPVARAAVLPTMGAQAAGGSFAEGDDPRVAVAKGVLEVLSEGASFGVADKIKDVILKLPQGAQQTLFANIAKRALAGGGAITGQMLAGTIEETVAQLGNNALDIYASGKQKSITDGLLEAAIVGGATSGVMGLPNAATAMRDNSPKAQVARELAQQLNSREPAPPIYQASQEQRAQVLDQQRAREQRIKTLRDAGETAAADLLQQKHDQATATESVDAELSAMPGNDAFAQQYRTLRTSGMKPAEAAARSAVTVTYGGMAMNTGVPDKAMQAAVNAAQGMPLDKVPGFFQKFTDGLVKRGLIQPSEALAQIGPALEAARDDAMEAAIGAAYQPVQSVMNDALALENATSEIATPNEAAQATPDQAPVAAIAPDAASVPENAPVQSFGVADESIAEQAAAPDVGAAPVSEAPELQPAASGVSAAPDKQAAYVGRDNTPLSEGGRPFKTRKELDDARKLNNTLRMVRVEGGYALAPKTEAQIAAQERAAKRLRLPQTSPKGEPMSAHAFIAAEGGLHADNRSDMGIEGNITIGNRKLFAGAGKGLTIERATERLIEEGYLQQGASHDQARNLINRSLNNPQYTPEGTERVAQEEMDRRFKEYEDQADYDDAVEEFEGLSDTQFQEIDDADIPWDEPSNSSTEDAMRALGFDEQEIQDAIANESRIQSQNSPGNGQVNESAGGQEGEDTGPRASPAGQDTGSRSDARRQEAPVSAPAAVSVSGNADGTLTVTGPNAAKKLQDAGVTKIMPTKDGVVVGKSQAEQAKDALSSRPEALIELRKRESILKSLLECMG